MVVHYEKLDHLTQTLKTYIYRDAISIDTWRLVDDLTSDSPMPDPSDPRWRAVSRSDFWGSNMSWAWLHAEVRIPPHFAGKPIALHMAFETVSDEPGGYLVSDVEALVTIQGLETKQQTINWIHPEIFLTQSAKPGSIGITVACFTGVSRSGDHRVRLKVSDVVWIDRDVEALYWDARVLLDTIPLLPDASSERSHYLSELDAAFREINWLNPSGVAFAESLIAAQAMLRASIFDPAPNTAEDWRPLVHAIGHAHIDVAWLWPLSVTRGKAVRTFSTALALMDQYSAYRFSHSTPYLYKTVSEDDPQLFEAIKARIRSGQWEATGATWVEMDANLPSGESLVRQFLFGMRYFQQKLGVRPDILWLPDVFGYTAALPQIMQGAGVRYFHTNKLSWNDHEKMPYDTFWWEGLDGSRVLTHLGTTPETHWEVGLERDYATYVAMMTPREIQGTWQRYKQKEINHHLMTLFGMGDGGGGPNRDMLERRARMENLPGLPRVLHSTAETFFRELHANVPDNLPQWVGELYLQFHRGTYTTHALLKRYNRKLEVLLHDVEALASIAALLNVDYPHDVLSAAWEIVLLNQFHDILPGSGTREVFDDAIRDYAHTHDLLNRLQETLLARIGENVVLDSDTPGFAVFNTLSMTLGDLVEIDLPGSGEVAVFTADKQRLPVQWLDREARRGMILLENIPPYGYTTFTVEPSLDDEPQSVEQGVSGAIARLENAYLRAEFDEVGNLIRLYDLEHDRDVLVSGAIGNQLWAYVDRPTQFDAWEVEKSLTDQGWQLAPASSRLVESGPLRATLEVTYRFNQSTIVQRVSLTANQRLLKFDTYVDWHERHIMLKTHFPLAIRAMNATYEIQFGAIERPVHRNTTWDQAQYEVPAQQWADLSESGYGASLINDCKYGYSAEKNLLSLSLLRSPTYPDPQADQGEHQFTYAIYPHAGDWRHGTIAHARRMNHPLRVRPLSGKGGQLPSTFSVITCESDSVIVDTIKQAEDSADLIVRLYEAHGGRTTATLQLAMPIYAAEEVNLLEESLGPVKFDGRTLEVTLTPYQIRSFRVRLSNI